ncbi:permease for cytosine/purines, uracil, thiamine, allantoin-domain-containing protein [Aspergillus pseudodeflectus]|uniref:Permease for cytosine/purines, uracil, thiamine, allantoin-domain-containing protein n=1 Tax=Aspergillus pseudodeflectus TaxID=176178 RepID=A0ABR4JZB2_9EURO
MRFPTSRWPQLLVPQSESSFMRGNVRWTNKDLDPVPPALRKWTVLSFIGYWISDCFSVANWQLASSIIAIGLSWKESLGMVALGFFILSIVIAMNGAVGAIYHVPFPVIARASWGFWGSYVPIVSRLVLAVFWFATNSVNGGNSVVVMLGAIWPSFLNIPNGLPQGEGITTQGMVGFLLFWLFQIPFLLVHPNQLRWLFLFKSIIVPAAWTAMLIWAFVAIPNGGDLFAQRSELSGPSYSWAMMSSLTAVIGNYATLSVNQADFSRYSCVSPRWHILYIFLLPAFFTFIAFIGIAVSSAGQAKYNTASIPWDPNVLVSLWGSRACRFFGAFSFALAALGSNISANSLSAANDFAALAPRYLTLRRGQILCAVLAWALVPWKILASAGTFLNFMSAYAIFLGPIAAIMVCDFWVVKKRRYDCVMLYQPRGIYRYTSGVNLHAFVAFIVGTTPSLPGLIHSVNSGIEIGVGVHPYEFGWLLGFAGSAAVYLGLDYWFPYPGAKIPVAVLVDDVLDAAGHDESESVERENVTNDHEKGLEGIRK